MEIITKGEGETEKLGQNFAGSLKNGDVVALFGNLGAGKSVFSRGVARGLGINEKISSPTYVFIKTYKKGKTVLHHIDLYRSQGTADLEALGLDEVFQNDAIVLIEWAEKIQKNLPQKTIKVYIEKIDDKKRKIKITYPDLDKAAEILKSGGVVIFPTDTVYGIGSIFNSVKAVKRIYKIKGREKTQAFPILVSSIQEAKKIAQINAVAQDLMQKHWPGGLTIIQEANGKKEKIGLRMPNSQLVLTLIQKVGKPIIGTSANFHGEKTPRKYEELDSNFTKLADFVIKGECKSQKQSTVVDATVNPPKVLRQGAVRI